MTGVLEPVIPEGAGRKVDAKEDVVGVPGQLRCGEPQPVAPATIPEIPSSDSAGTMDLKKPAGSEHPVGLDQEWPLLRVAHPNVLVVGDDVSALHGILSTLRDGCRQPVVTGVTTDPLSLPSRDTCGTLILRDILSLSLTAQQELLDWLEHVNGRAQVITTATEPPWAHVKAGTFLCTLYYRLNTVYVDLTSRQGRREDEGRHSWSQPNKSQMC